MDDKVVGDYGAAITIDGSTHYLLIQPGNASTAYNKINRNVLLGVTGQPMDISSSQSVTNKTLDNTNTITLKDTLFTLQDDGDATKQAKFQLSGISTSTTRTYTLPNASSTLADIATTQTFTNKTLTAPVINNGSITGTTITTDAIVGQAAATTGTIYGLSIASSKVGTNGVVAGSITDAAVTPAKLVAGTGGSWAWQSWSPTYAQITVGNGVVEAKYTQIGKTVFGKFSFTLGSTSAIGTAPNFSPPVTPTSFVNRPILGQVAMTSGGTDYIGYVQFLSPGPKLLIQAINAASTSAKPEQITATVPDTWANNDQIVVYFQYEAA